MKRKIRDFCNRHWHTMTIAGSVGYFFNAVLEGNHMAAIMVTLVVTGAIFHLGDVE